MKKKVQPCRTPPSSHPRLEGFIKRTKFILLFPYLYLKKYDLVATVYVVSDV